ncbi:Gfo/Idh/MocA family protein [Phormidium sp. CCY1219]|uniref:Gfo/Idh/MocA family protein n=1 Tax=Phormidium sp. CCY1219 TaxID=2886104 RepID=UPI002D1E5753|nr:Gfo/Idh/MocA family oxidoreductase [Phormidium sp. CCY1219]MEB3828032.1 Gfo/Idh/MocA family oxidoreductase [Phormidium sp. CCY1219]
MSNQIGIAILGAGRWGVHLVRNFLEHPQTRVMAVVDPHAERLSAARTRFNLDESVVLATDWQEVKQLPALDAVAIATPASTHYSLITEALKQNLHVFAEKPLTLDSGECRELCHLAQQQRRVLFIDHTYLFHPAVEAGKQVLDAGRLGELRYGYATRTHLGPIRQDVDALWDLGIHDIAIFNNWVGQRPIQAQATGRVWLQETPQRMDKAELFPQGLSDFVMATLTYPNQFRAFIHLCWLNPDKQRRLAVVGTKGTLIFDELSAESPLVIQHGEVEASNDRLIPTGLSREVVSVEAAEPLGRVCDRFVRCVGENCTSATFSPLGSEPIASGAIGTEFVVILQALSESVRQGGQPIAIGQD